jgi:hypothetical protein
MATGTVGDSARLFPWQMSHYIVKGGPNDPSVLPPTGGPPVTGAGYLSWNSSIVVPPVPGASPATPRTMSLHNGGTLTTGQLVTGTGGIFIGTIPQGAWLLDLNLFCYASLAGGTDASVGIFYVRNSLAIAQVYPVVTLNLLAYITSPAADTMYGIKTTQGVTAFTAVNATVGPTGPGDGVAGIKELASIGDIDLYVASFLIAGGGTANTGGSYGVMVEFTGLEG